jgi:NOL1/NOP2/fmu family ribosome biogenesis protein
LGKVVRGELIPGHALALAPDVPCTAEWLPLDEVQALSYLRGEAIRIQADSGWHRVAFDSCVLGWVKVIGNRINNYYPKEWRVKLKE